MRLLSSKNFNRMKLFELLFIIDYIKYVILKNLNNNITGDIFGEILRCLGFWSLSGTVIGPFRESFFGVKHVMSSVRYPLGCLTI